MLATLPNMLIVHPSVNAATVTELVSVLKANPNKYSFGSAGNGTSQHISGELFKIMTGTQMQHIPYKGSGPMIPDLLPGTIQLSFENITTAYPQVKAGKLKALAVTSSKRSFVAPEVPTMAEAGLAGYDISSWQAMYAPAGTPKEIVARLHARDGEDPARAGEREEAAGPRPGTRRHGARGAHRSDARRDPAARQGGARLRREGRLTTTSPGDVVARRSTNPENATM